MHSNDSRNTASEPSRHVEAAFPLFSRLPPEIRALVWREALPMESEDSPVLFAYRRGCWQPRHLLPSDPNYLQEWGPDHNIDFGFHHYLLDPVQLDVPLYFVSHESLRVALAWIRRQCVETWPYCGRTLFSRWFEKDRDILYITESSGDEFLVEPEERPFESDLLEKTISTGSDNFTNLAMPASVLNTDPSMILDMFPLYAVETLFLVVGQQPKWDQWSPLEGRISRRFELEEESHGKALIWDAGTETLELGSGLNVIDKDLQRFREAHGEDLISELVSDNIRTFRIQPTHLKDEEVWT